MIKLANILPKSFIKNSSIATSNQIEMVLAHKVLDDQEYLKIFSEKKKQGIYTILDNSAFEFGKSIEFSLLNKAIEKLHPDEFVLPDNLFDANETIRLSEEFISKYTRTDLKIKFMAVPHGKTLEEYLDCYKRLVKNPKISVIGIGAIYAKQGTFSLNSEYVSGRELILNELINRGIIDITKEHHLLGLGDSGHLELRALKKYKRFRSCDSSAAYILAKNKVTINPEKTYQKIREHINFSDEFDPEINQLLINNISVLKENAN